MRHSQLARSRITLFFMAQCRPSSSIIWYTNPTNRGSIDQQIAGSRTTKSWNELDIMRLWHNSWADIIAWRHFIFMSVTMQNPVKRQRRRTIRNIPDAINLYRIALSVDTPCFSFPIRNHGGRAALSEFERMHQQYGDLGLQWLDTKCQCHSRCQYCGQTMWISRR